MNAKTTLLFFVCAVFFSGFLYSQSPKYELGINTSCDFSYRLLKYNNETAINGLIIEQRNDRESFALRFASGINFSMNLNSKFGFYTGLGYSNKGYKSNVELISSFTGGVVQTINYKSQVSFHYIEIPFQLFFNIFGNSESSKTGLRLRSGISNNILLKVNNKYRLYYDDGSFAKYNSKVTDNYKAYMLQAILGVDFTWSLFTNLNLRIGPEFKYGINSIVDAPIHGYLFSCGINFSLTKNIGK